MAAPTTYSDWVTIFERFEDGDDTVFLEMNIGNFVLDAGTSQRFCVRAEKAYKKRKQNWLDKFQRSLQNIKTEGAFEIALQNGKQNLSPLLKFVLSKGLPEDLRKTLQKDLNDFVSEIKKSSKDDEKILIMLNTFSLPEIPQEKQIQKKSENNIIPPTGRRIIF